MKKKTGITNRFIKLNDNQKVQELISKYIFLNCESILDEVIPENAYFDIDKACLRSEYIFVGKNRIRVSIFVDYFIEN
jgi:hypothetical protein